MIISIIEGEPFAPSEKEEGIWDQRETSHPSSILCFALLCSAVRWDVEAPVPPKLRRQANFSNSIQIWQRSERNEEKKETSLNLCGKNRQINLGRPARTPVCANAASRRSGSGKECQSVCAAQFEIFPEMAPLSLLFVN